MTAAAALQLGNVFRQSMEKADALVSVAQKTAQVTAQAASAAAPVDSGLSLEKIRFRYAISGSNPPWKPLRAFDDGEKVYIQFPPGIAQGELPPLFVVERLAGCAALALASNVVVRSHSCDAAASLCWMPSSVDVLHR
jgi:type IV secretory pathway VirB9-like protein